MLGLEARVTIGRVSGDVICLTSNESDRLDGRHGFVIIPNYNLHRVVRSTSPLRTDRELSAYLTHHALEGPRPR